MRKNGLRNTFSSAMRYAVSAGVDLILIAGDLFDSENVTRETSLFLEGEFEKVSPIPVLISPGNHDPYNELSPYAVRKFSSNVHIFRSETLEKKSFDSIGCDVYGYAFTSRSLKTPPFAGKTPDDAGRVNVLLAHADLLSRSEVCPASAETLAATKFDYVALGHIHSGTELMRESGTYWSYPGCIEGRDFGECGVKGGNLITIDKTDGTFTVDFKKVRFSSRRFEKTTLDVTSFNSARSVALAVRELVKNGSYDANTSLRVELVGETDPTFVLTDDYFADAGEGLYDLDIKDSTTPAVDREELKNDISLRGEFYSLLEPRLSSEDPEVRETAERALRYGLAALYGNNIVD